MIAAAAALTACGLPPDGRVRPAPALSDGSAGTSYPVDECLTETAACGQAFETRKQMRAQLAAETIRIRTASQGQ